MSSKKLVQVIGEQGITRPLLALLFASTVSVSLVGLRILVTGHQQLFLVWNLFLAWLPLFFALQVCRLDRLPSPRRWKFFGAGAAWFLFFPNAPYLCTDLVHLMSRRAGNFWVDLVVILLFALNGLLLGFLSLRLMQTLVARRFGWVTGWLFTAAVIGLSGFGVFIGRFMRWNSWDVVTNPFGLLGDLANWFGSRAAAQHLLLFTALFGTFLFLAHVMFSALTNLQLENWQMASPARFHAGDDDSHDGGVAGEARVRVQKEKAGSMTGPAFPRRSW